MAPRFKKVALTMYRLCYRLTGGAIGGSSGGMPILLLTTTGRKTGKPRTTPLYYVKDGENIVVVASNGGRPRHPLWWLNLEKNPQADVQVRNEKRRVKAEEASGEERERLWRLVVGTAPGYEEFQRATTRRIPVVVLRPRK
jgi:deazaflavin-dependent oxidoreductase (nitroreductase family)